LWAFYPRLLETASPSREERESVKKITWWSNWALGLAAFVPLSSISLVMLSSISQEKPNENVLKMLITMVVASLVGLLLAFGGYFAIRKYAAVILRTGQTEENGHEE
jgi:hypothetical protein